LYLIRNILIPISKKIDLEKAISRKIGIAEIGKIRILRRSIDARKKNHLKYNFTLVISPKIELKPNYEILNYEKPKPYLKKVKKIVNPHPFIIGAGPAGLFAALSLVEKGSQPYIFERGDSLEKRSKKVAEFWQKGILDEESNVQFGEGGAGTFSDGKLTSRTRDFYTNKVVDYLIKFGADEKIKYDALPHLGTDGIRKIVKNIRKYLTEKGCKFFWNHKLEDIEITKNKITNLLINGKKYNPEIVILAIGNSARDTFIMLNKKIELQNKPFSVGIRIEHSQQFIDETFYGKKNDFTITGPATYRLTTKYQNRGIYSFCMCPGGSVIASSSQKGKLVLNGMSYENRNNFFANSAIICTVNEKDFGYSKLDGIKFQEQIEKKCFNPDYKAPFQTARDFLNNTISTPAKTSYENGIIPKNISDLLPTKISECLKFGLIKFEEQAKDFISKGNLLAPEIRTSSPIKIMRKKDSFNATKMENLYPIGEGSGYAGGIMSSATDGFKVGSIFKKSNDF